MLSMEQIGYYLYMESQDKAEKEKAAAAMGSTYDGAYKNKEKQEIEYKKDDKRAYALLFYFIKKFCYNYIIEKNKRRKQKDEKRKII